MQKPPSSGPPAPLILSIQSHTVHGFVGNKCATFPVQLLGINIDPVNSVQLSNHKGYKGGAKGYVLNGDQLSDLVEGLRANGVLPQYTHLLTGYIGSASFLDRVCEICTSMRQSNPSLAYFCDPVMGDHGVLYVPSELVELFRKKILPLATVLTPNQFECELLTGKKIASVEDAWEACDLLHAEGVSIIIVTSCYLNDKMFLLASRRSGGSSAMAESLSKDESKRSKKQGVVERYKVDIPIIEGRFSGTGDLTAALLLAWTIKLGETSLSTVLANTCNSVRSVVLATRQSFLQGNNPHCELRLVESAKDILHPPCVLSVERCHGAGDGE